MDWRKSSYSADTANCVEVKWRRSSRCSTASPTCVEVAEGEQVRVRDSKNPGPELAFDRAQFAAFLTAVKAGDFGSLTA